MRELCVVMGALLFGCGDDGGSSVATCGNGVVESNETCDGDCPTTCTDGTACTADRLVGSADGCDASCEFDPITACANGDGCCAGGCDATTDDDCSATCGNGTVEAGENCDGSCPTSCDDGGTCTTDTLVGSASSCSASCSFQPIVACANGDGCCPGGCTATTDTDCSATCGNLTIEGNETCDGNCPTSCSDGNACTIDVLAGSASSCSAECTTQAITQCISGDGCCAPGCVGASDTDCPVLAVGGDLSDNVFVGHSCALIGGAVRCWGSGGYLGYGNTTVIGDNETPAAAGVVSLGATAVAIGAGSYHTCAVVQGGSARCWGDSAFGQLGYGNANFIGNDETPSGGGAAYLPLDASAVAFAGGHHHTCALLASGGVKCWGEGASGRLGYGNTNSFGAAFGEHPINLPNVSLGGTAIAIAAGRSHTCAILTGGAVRCWGAGFAGQLGYGNTNDIGDNETPDAVAPVSLGGSAIAITAGSDHTCAILTGGAVRCWGAGSRGRLGYANIIDIGDNETPATAGDVELGGPAVAISAGYQHTCAILAAGTLRCWGSGSSGRLGYANTIDIGDNETPASAGDVQLGGSAATIAAGAQHTCASLVGGAIRCWGDGMFGKLGYGNTITIGDNETPASAGNVMVQ